MKRTTTVMLIAAAIVATVLSVWIVPKTNIRFAANPAVTRSEANQIALDFLQGRGYDLDGYWTDAFFWYDETGLAYFSSEYDVEHAINRARNGETSLTEWRFFFYRNVPRSQDFDFYRIWISARGEVLGFEYHPPLNAPGDSLSAEQARETAEKFLQEWPAFDFSAFSLQDQRSFKRPNRLDYTCTYRREGPDLKAGAEQIDVTVSGSQLTRLEFHFFDSPEFLQVSASTQTAMAFLNILGNIVLLTLTVFNIVLFLRAYHRGEIGARRILTFAGFLVVVVALMLVNIWHLMTNFSYTDIGPLNSKLQMFFFNTTGFLFISVTTVFAWANGENIIRSNHPWLLAGIDSLFNRRLITKNVGRELPKGILYGVILYGMINVIMFILIQGLGKIPYLYYPSLVMSSTVPLLSIILLSVFFGLLLEGVFRLCLIPYFYGKFNNEILAISLSTLISCGFLGFFDFGLPGLQHMAFMFIPIVIVGFYQGIVFWRNGILTSTASMIVFILLNYSTHLLAMSSTTYFLTGMAVLVGIVGALILGFYADWKGKVFEYTPVTEPAHVRRIKERVRVTHELEVARNVQLGLLPKTTPAIPNFDLAGACVPAYEVGGDYFDFFEFNDHQFGLVVADVSGKGVPAAIYMTLTKGILQSHAETEISPRQVLMRVNNLMYRTLNRGSFVSMFYAVLDAKEGTLCFARAGHNPGIVIESNGTQIQLLQTAGIGLGLESGPIFDRTLVEGKLRLRPEDMVVFYTDGFTEAMNNRLEEYGEDRLCKLLREKKGEPAARIVESCYQNVREFAHGFPQNDDMTIVVLRAM